MRIVHVIASLDPNSGGPPAVVTRLAAAQSALGVATEILVPQSVGLSFEIDQLNQGVVGFSKVKVTAIDSNSWWYGKLGGSLKHALTSEAEGNRILHLHGIWDPIIMASSRLARNYGIPYVVAPHGMLDPWSLSAKRWKKQLALLIGYRTMLMRADGFHALNTNECNQIRQIGFNGKVCTIPNGVNLSEVKSGIEVSSSRSIEPEASRRPYFLFLGRLHFKKGLDLLAEAFHIFSATNREFDLVVAGPDCGEEQAFRKQIDNLGISDRVKVVGAVGGSEKARLLSGAACFCLPSRSEGFSVAVLEALACGTPVVISSSCYFPEVAEKHAGIVIELSPSMLADAMGTIIQNRDDWTKFSNNARELVREEYTWARIASKSLECYRNLHKSQRTL